MSAPLLTAIPAQTSSPASMPSSPLKNVSVSPAPDFLPGFCYSLFMDLEYTYWQGTDWFVGFLNDYPKYKTQGKNLAELEDMLLDLYENIKIEESSQKDVVLKSGRIRIPA
jgi:hypothetical protein